MEPSLTWRANLLLDCLKRLKKKTAWKIGMRMSRTFTKLLTKAQWIHFPSSRPIKYDNDRKRSRDVTGKKISSLGNRSACRRTPIGLDGFVLLVYFQLKRRKQQRTRSALVQHSSMCWGVFTVPVAKRQYVFKKHPSLVSSGAAYICGLIEWGWIRKTDFIKTSRRAPAPEAKKLRGKSHSALRDWNMETQKRKQMQAHTHTHTWPLSCPSTSVLTKIYSHSHRHTARVGMIVWMRSVAGVVPSTVVLLLGQFPDDSLQLFARLLLLLQELLHPLILL